MAIAANSITMTTHSWNNPKNIGNSWFCNSDLEYLCCVDGHSKDNLADNYKTSDCVSILQPWLPLCTPHNGIGVYNGGIAMLSREEYSSKYVYSLGT